MLSLHFRAGPAKHSRAIRAMGGGGLHQRPAETILPSAPDYLQIRT